MKRIVRGNRQILLATLSWPSEESICRWYGVTPLLYGFASELAVDFGLHPIRTVNVPYPRGGETVTTYLAESHITIETYPEHKLMEFEAVSCKRFDPDALRRRMELTDLSWRLLKSAVLFKTPGHEWLRS